MGVALITLREHSDLQCRVDAGNFISHQNLETVSLELKPSSVSTNQITGFHNPHN